ncbi:MAG: acetate--CoA ligase family protein [Johnsonella sp.]|nr:acetate--CoA ligase family protein [Johnsonella sp.]
MDLNKLLAPESVAVIGASEKEGFGGDTCRNILTYKKNLEKVYFVNPKRESVFGVKCHKNISEIQDSIDLMIICTPQKTVISLLEEGAKKGCKGAVVYASGYGELGTKEGRENEEELKKAAQRLGIAIMGPNCAGFVNYINQVFAFAFISETRDRTGKVGVVSQSGQLCLSMMESPGMRFSYIISAGNSKIVQTEDYFHFLIDNEDSKVIAAYIEGVRNPEKFIGALRKAAEKKKPVIILKAGKSAKSAEIAASHTGSLAGSDKAFDAVLKKFGAIRVDDLEELIAMSMMLSVLPSIPEKDTYTIMSLSGGETAISADVGYLNGIKYPDFEEKTIEKLKKQLPTYATPNNPLDMTASLSYDADLYAGALRTVANDNNIGMVIIGYTLLFEIFDPAIHYMYKGIEKVVAEGCKKPIALMPFAENTRNPEYLKRLSDIGVPVLPPPIYALKLLRYLSEYIAFRSAKRSLETALPTREPENIRSFSEYESKRLLSDYGIQPGKEQIVRDAEEAGELAKKNADKKYAMKIESPDILHKSDVGGVKLNVMGEKAARETFSRIIENVRSKRPEAKINGILMGEMLKPGVEMIIGVKNDPQFGPMLMVGMGGIFVELFGDVALHPAPLEKEEAVEMLKSLKAYRLLKGYRGAEACDLEAFADTMVKVSKFAADHKDRLKELDINPLFVYPDGVGIADALIIMGE